MKPLFVRLSLIVAMSAGAHDASAFSAGCQKITSLGVRRNSVQAPNGSLRAGAIANAYVQWAKAMPAGVFGESGTFSGEHNVSEPPSEISFATPGLSFWLPAGLGGNTFVRTSGCTITGIDILLADNVTYALPPDEGVTGNPAFGLPDPGWHIVVHEFGHAIGLALGNTHPTTFAVMRGSGPFVTFGAFPFRTSSAALAPDDAAGARFLYGQVGSPHNLASTQTQLASDGVIRNLVEPATVRVCRGQTISLPVNTANTGVFQQVIDHKLYIQPVGRPNTHESGDPTNILIAQNTNALHNANNTNMFTMTARLPCSTPQGQYKVMHFADATNRVAEYDEWDNVSQFPLTFTVDCLSATCAFGGT